MAAEQNIIFDEIKLAVIGGSSLLKSEKLNKISLRKQVLTSPEGFGEVIVHFGPTFCFVQRHQADPQIAYSQPAKINTKAIVDVLANVVKVQRVVTFASVGSLKPDLPVGSIMLIDDIFCPWYLPTAFDDFRGHFVPEFDTPVRKDLLQLLGGISEIPFFKKTGVYVQTMGPRFETRSEIRWMATVADVVGMTVAAESTLALERKLDFACIAVVDNLANGIELQEGMSLDKFHEGVKSNLQVVELIFETVLNKLC